MDGHSWLGLVLLLGALALLVSVAAAEAGVSLNQARLQLLAGRDVSRAQLPHAPTQADARRERETILSSLALARSLAGVAASALAFFLVSRVIGSDTMLVAPVEVGERSATGAGSVVNRNVPPDSLAVGAPARIRPRRSRRSKGA